MQMARGVTRLTDSPGFDGVPAWSPDGSRIVFVRSRERRENLPDPSAPLSIWMMDSDGTNQVRLTQGALFEGWPVWSPDGTRVAFERRLDDGNYDIYIVNADGTGQTRLTDDPAEERNPSWSPDGRKILFERGRPRDVYVMNADGTEKRNLTDSPWWDFVPQWSPDGSRIAFVRVIPGPGQSPHGGNEEIHVMNADGSEVQRLTNDLSTDYWPKWRPGRQ